MKRNLSGFVITLLCILSVGSLFSESALAQGYACPEKIRYESDTPFTLAEIEAILDFSHPTLQEVADSPENDENRDSNFSYFVGVTCTPFNGTFYVTVIHIHEQVVDEHLRQVLYLHVFHLQSGQVLSTASRDIIGCWLTYTRASGFADRNFNGLPDIFITTTCGGSSPGFWMQVIEFDSQQEILFDITPVGFGDAPAGFNDINNDGIPEVYDYTWYYVPTFFTDQSYYYTWLEWNGSTYERSAVNVVSFTNSNSLFSISNPPSDDSGSYILSYLSNLSRDNVCEAISQTAPFEYAYSSSEYAREIRWKLFHSLLYYHVWDNLDMGWAHVYSITNTAENCPDSEGKTIFFEAIEAYEIYFEELEEL